MTDETTRLLDQCDRLARQHCGMPLDLARLVSNRAYRETVFRILENSRESELSAAVARLRAALSNGARDGSAVRCAP